MLSLLHLGAEARISLKYKAIFKAAQISPLTIFTDSLPFIGENARYGVSGLSLASLFLRAMYRARTVATTTTFAR